MTPYAHNRTRFRSDTGATIVLSALPRFQGAGLDFSAAAGSRIDLPALTEFSQGPISVTADGSNTVIDLSSLCTYDNTTLTETNGGDIQHAGVPLTDFTNRAVFGVRSLGQTGACSGPQCNSSALFSFIPGGASQCFRQTGLVTLSGSRIDLDAVAVSPNYGVLAFELLHDPATGAVTGSRLVALTYQTAIANAVGPVLAGRAVRGAAFVGDNLYALDTNTNSLLQVSPSQGTIVGSALPLTLNNLPFNLGERSDLALNRDATMVLSDENRLYIVDRQTGVLTLLLHDQVPVQGLTLPDFSGLAFSANATATAFELFELIVGVSDRILKHTETLARSVVYGAFNGVPALDATRGDLGSVSTVDTTAPGPVTITVSPTGDGTYVTANWPTYDEAANGNDIHHYNVYKSATSFTNTAQATLAGTTSAGIKTYRLENLTRNQQIFVAVTAQDNVGNVNPIVTAIPTTPVDIQPPAEVTQITTTSGATSVQLQWQASTSNDTAFYRVYRDTVNVSGNIPPAQTNFTLTNLLSATGYNVRITALDQSLNESPGVSLTVATRLNNPSGVTATGQNARIDLSWNAVNPGNLVGSYRVYAAETPYTSVASLTPRRVVQAGTTSTQLAGLQNGHLYYVAVTAVNISGGENQTVTTVTATPQPDTAGPALSNPRFAGLPLIANQTIAASGELTLQASDPSGVTRVDFYIRSGPARTLLFSDINSANGFQAQWNLANFPDGPYTIEFEAFDAVSNMTPLAIPVVVLYGPPAAPVISQPSNSAVVTASSIQVSGSAPVETTVRVLRAGSVVAGPYTVNGAGAFAITVPLAVGANVLTATATGRGGVSAPSAPVTVTLDTALPEAPTGLTALSEEGGEIRLTWNEVLGSTPLQYNLYRSSTPFTTTAQAVRINSSPLALPTFLDLPTGEGTFYYRVLAVNGASVEGVLSSQVSALSDSTGPRAVSISYASTGLVDPVSGRMAPGVVTALLTLSEPALTTPFLTITPDQGTPIPVTLAQQSATVYQGSFQITPTTKSGVAYAVFSARDAVGNRGTEITTGGTILIDTAGPSVDGVVLTPPSPIQNSSTSPVTVNVSLTLSDDPKPNTTPELLYLLSGAGRTPVAVTNLQQSGGNPRAWAGSFTLPADGGQAEPENVTLQFRAVDDLDNESTTISAPYQLQVYQGSLPPLAVPVGLSATPRAGGRVQIRFVAVPGAAGYQLWRRDPGQISLQRYGPMITVVDYLDQTPLDGSYEYAVASVRQVGSILAESAPSASVTVTSDSVPPNPPQSFQLSLQGYGVRADWLAPTGASGSVSYAMYRANLPPNTPIVPNGTPLQADIPGLLTVDSVPSESEHAYAVTARDAAGNESAASNTVYLNFALLPVRTFTVDVEPESSPELSWSYVGSAASSFKLELIEGSTRTTLQQGAATSFTDTGYTGGARAYAVTAFDSNTSPSAERRLEIPAVDVLLPTTPVLKRGVMNRMTYTVQNHGASAVPGLSIVSEVLGIPHESPSFTLQPNETRLVDVVIGGYEALGAAETLTTRLRYAPNVGDLVQVARADQVSVESASLVVALETETLTHGATGRVRFSVFNSSQVVTEIVTARANGAQPSDDVQLVLSDREDNVFASRSFQQFTGASVVTLANGTTVARILPEQTFTSDWITVDVPLSAPELARVSLGIDFFHHALGTPQHVVIAGHGTSRDVLLTPPAYRGVITSITPTASYGAPVTIVGQALDNQTDLPSGFQPLDLVLSSSGFERKLLVTTLADGSFQATLTPAEYPAGLYTVSAVFPGTLDRPNQGQLTLHAVSASPTSYDVRIPKNYNQPVPLTVTSGAATTATQLRLRYLASDQPSLSLTPGLQVTLPAPVNLSPQTTQTLTFHFAGESSAPDLGEIYLRLESNESGQSPLALIRVQYRFSEAVASVAFSPTLLETGVVYNQVVYEPVVLTNNGLAPLLDAQVQFLTQAGGVPPNWAYMTSAPFIPRLEVNEQRQVQLAFNPDPSISEGFYYFKVRVTAPNEPPYELPVVVSVRQNGIGGVIVHASDIYTGTLNQQSQPIPGLASAFVRIQKVTDQNVTFTGTTDSFGELLLQNVPAGEYLVRASAAGHQDVLTHVFVHPDIVTPAELFLRNEVISVTWSVHEITIEDRYQIILNLVFQTQVPVAVVVIEPVGVELPTLRQGDVFYGEFNLTNYGLIAAQNLSVQLPAQDGRASYEFFASIPTTLAPQQRVVVPYRITALQNFSAGSGSTATGGGSGSCHYANQLTVNSESICANGQHFGGSATIHWYNTRQCPISGGSGGIIGGVIGGGGGSGGTYSGGGASLPNLTCVPGIPCDDAVEAPTN